MKTAFTATSYNLPDVDINKKIGSRLNGSHHSLTGASAIFSKANLTKAAFLSGLLLTGAVAYMYRQSLDQPFEEPILPFNATNLSQCLANHTMTPPFNATWIPSDGTHITNPTNILNKTDFCETLSNLSNRTIARLIFPKETVADAGFSGISDPAAPATSLNNTHTIHETPCEPLEENIEVKLLQCPKMDNHTTIGKASSITGSTTITSAPVASVIPDPLKTETVDQNTSFISLSALQKITLENSPTAQKLNDVFNVYSSSKSDHQNESIPASMPLEPTTPSQQHPSIMLNWLNHFAYVKAASSYLADAAEWTGEAYATSSEWTTTNYHSAKQWTGEAYAASSEWTTKNYYSASQWTGETYASTSKWAIENFHAATQWTGETYASTSEWAHSAVWSLHRPGHFKKTDDHFEEILKASRLANWIYYKTVWLGNLTNTYMPKAPSMPKIVRSLGLSDMLHAIAP